MPIACTCTQIQMNCMDLAGGRLEHGETLAACAVRETEEETGIRLRCDAVPEKVYTGVVGWECPWPLTVVDGLFNGPDGNLQYHYVIVEMLATVLNPTQEPVAADDANSAGWFLVSSLRDEGVCRSCCGCCI
jgi:8-oxo-dGTP diphosphatase